MGARRSGEVGRSEIEAAADSIEQFCRTHGQSIRPESLLSVLLTNARRLASGPIAFKAATGSEEDAQAITIGERALSIWRLAESIRALEQVSSAKLRQSAVDLTRLDHGNTDREEEFWNHEYELFSGSDFALSGSKVNFVSTSQKSQFVKKVEFIVEQDIPVECKRAAVLSNIIARLNDAADKIIERDQNGIICLSFDRIVFPGEPFIEAANVEEFDSNVSAELQKWWRPNRDRALQLIDGTPVKAVIVHVKKCLYSHDSDHVSLPTIREGFLSSGEWIQENVIKRSIDAVRAG